MSNLTLKNVPNQVHDGLKELARARGQSLNSLILTILGEQVSEAEDARRKRVAWEEYKRFRAGLPELSDSSELLREDRDR